jgi:hypothetical protein
MPLGKMFVGRERCRGGPAVGRRLGEGERGDLGEASREWVHEHVRAHRDVPSTDIDRRPSSHSRHHQRPICLITSQSETPCRVCDHMRVIGASVGAKRDVVSIMIVEIGFTASFHG